MSPKWAKKAHFGDISYNVFKSSYLMLETPYLTIFCWMDHFNESNHQKLIFLRYFLYIYKNTSAWFWCYRVYQIITTIDVIAILVNSYRPTFSFRTRNNITIITVRQQLPRYLFIFLYNTYCIIFSILSFSYIIRYSYIF